jgi:hypothetical protein
MKTDHFTKPLRGGYSSGGGTKSRGRIFLREKLLVAVNTVNFMTFKKFTPIVRKKILLYYNHKSRKKPNFPTPTFISPNNIYLCTVFIPATILSHPIK